MERLDLEQPRFTQAQVLEILPSLTAKTLQNWASRGIIDVGEQKPGSQGKRLYTPLGVIMLGFMSEAVEMIPPSAARDMADYIAEAALQVWALEIEERDEAGVPSISILFGRSHLYRRGYISKSKSGEYFIRVQRQEPMREFMPNMYLVIEVDILVMSLINRIHSFLYGRKWPEKPEPVPDNLTDEERARRFDVHEARLMTLPERI